MADPGALAEPRAHPRYELLAWVLVKQVEEMVTLTVRNLSLDGAFLEAEVSSRDGFPIGGRLKLIIFDPNDLLKQTAAAAEVVRHDVEGLDIAWLGETARTRIAALLEQLTPPTT